MAKINKDDKVVDELYQENQRLYTKLGEVYDDYLSALDFIKQHICGRYADEVKKNIDEEIKKLQEEANK